MPKLAVGLHRKNRGKHLVKSSRGKRKQKKKKGNGGKTDVRDVFTGQ